MRKRILSILLTLCMVLSIAPAAVFADGSTAPADITGTGAADDPYLIYTAEGLRTFRDIVNGQNGQTWNVGVCAKLMNDIDLGGEQWTPIGSSDVYMGIFDGNGKTISGLNVTGVKNAGLFGRTIEATIRNLAVDGTVSGLNYAGGIVGTSDYGTTIEGCVNLCRVSASGYSVCAGGIVGCLDYTLFSSSKLPNFIKNCANFGEISVGGADYDIYVGGIVGCMDPEDNPITGCYSVGKVSSSSKGADIGGIYGFGRKDHSYYLIDTVQGDRGYSTTTKAKFANDVLALLQNGDASSPWTKTGYVASVGMTLPLLDWQTADSHDHNHSGLFGGCTCGVLTHTGNETDPYPISTAEDLKTFRDLVNSGETNICAKLTADIVLNDGTFDEDGNYTKGASGADAEKWAPIGSYSGTFDGNGKTIKGVYVVRDNLGQHGYIGLFSSVHGGTVKNVAVTGYVAASDGLPGDAGGIVGALANGTIEGCVNMCRVVSDITCAGGIAGMARYSTIKNCVNLGEISASSYNDMAGGVVGALYFNSTITNCYNAGRVTNGGGIVGDTDDDKVVNSYYLTGTAEKAAKVGNVDDAAAVKAKAEFANNVLALLQNGDASSPWTKTGYVASVGMTLPLLDWQTADSHDHNHSGLFGGCTCGKMPAGTAADPYLIFTAEDLKAFRDKVNAGETSLCAKLMNDIDLGEEEWLPIGSESHPYAGGFDGQGYTVKALKIQMADCAGLFGCTNGATIKNVTVIGKIETAVNAYKADEEYVVYAGGVVGRAANTRIENCTNKVRVYASMGNDYVNKDYTAYAGGIAGYTSGSTVIVGCTNSGKTLSDSYRASAYAGGMAGYAKNGVTIENCLNNAEVKATTSRNKTLPDGSECDAIMAFARAGGMVGVAADGVSVIGCYNIGEVSTLASGDASGQSAVGGIIGVAFAQLGDITVANCGNAAMLYAWSKSGAVRAGGIVCEASAVNGCVLTISNCYSTGSISIPDDRDPAFAYAGGAAGLAMADSGDLTISNCYWLTDTCDKAVGNIQGTPTIIRVAAHSKNDFATGFVQSKFDAASAWTNRGYLKAAGLTLPLLSWQTADAHIHSEKTGICLNGIYCECGCLMHMATSGHDWSEWRHLTTSHNRNCKNPGCGVTQSGNCSGGTATCTEPAECSTCGGKYGNTDPNNHTGPESWTTTATHHEKKWSCCNAVSVASESHEWAGGSCSECGYACTHTGGTATCTEKATCAICGEKYGDIKSHDYSTDWSQDVSKHWHKCKNCEARAGEAAHNDADRDHKCDICATVTGSCADNNRDHKCDICGKVLSTHTGGKVTCTEKATCAICGEKYGEITSHSYSEKWVSDDTEHWHECIVCGGNTAGEAHTDADKNHKCDICGKVLSTHTGGTATCTEKATCAICGEKYGDIKSHDYSADWSQDAAKHWHKCKNCEARAGEVAHDDADKNHKCDICDKVLNECADNDRDHKCDICGKALSTHTGGKATCKEKATCELCGEKYGENDANNHAELEHIEAKSATKTSEGNTEYWYCSDCGRYYGDAAAEKEIAKADTVTAKLPDDSEPPQEEKNTNTVLLIALSLVGVAIATAVIVIIVKKKHIKK